MALELSFLNKEMAFYIPAISTSSAYGIYIFMCVCGVRGAVAQAPHPFMCFFDQQTIGSLSISSHSIERPWLVFAHPRGLSCLLTPSGTRKQAPSILSLVCGKKSWKGSRSCWKIRLEGEAG